jgi:hypothetical protein
VNKDPKQSGIFSSSDKTATDIIIGSCVVHYNYTLNMELFMRYIHKTCLDHYNHKISYSCHILPPYNTHGNAYVIVHAHISQVHVSISMFCNLLDQSDTTIQVVVW